MNAIADEHGKTVIPIRAFRLVMSGAKSRRVLVAGSVVLALGVALVLASFVNVSRTYTVIDTAFTLEAGEAYSHWENGIRYSPPKDCVLKGQVAVEGEGIHVAFHEFFDREIEYSYVDGNFTFTIDPAAGWDHSYVFTFDNTAGDAESRVEFVLDETRTENLVWGLWPPGFYVLSWLGFLLLLSILAALAAWVLLLRHFCGTS